MHSDARQAGSEDVLRSVPTPVAARQKVHAIGVTVVLNLLASLSFTVISLVTPYIGTSLGASAQDELWLTDAYLIALVAATLLSGYASSAFGRKNLLLGSVLGIGAVSALGSVAGNLMLLTLFCFVMGAFAGTVAPTTQTLIAEVFKPEQRGLAMAIWGAGSTLGLLVGALATGLLLEHNSWRPAFLLGVLVALLALPPLLALEDTAPPRLAAARTNWAEGTFLLTALLSFGVFVNLGDNYGWLRSPAISFSLLLAVVTSVLFYRRYRISKGHVVDFSVLRNQQFVGATAIALGVAAFSTGQFQIDLLAGPLQMPSQLISLRSALGAVALLAGVTVGGRLITHVAAPQVVLSALAVTLVGKYAFTAYGPGIGVMAVVWPQLVSGFGLGVLATTLAVVAYGTLAPSAAQAGASFFVLSGSLGSALGLALLGVVLNLYQLRAEALAVGVAGDSLRQPFLDVFWLEFIGTALCIGFVPLLYQHKPDYGGAK